jgi:hypothetical protein
MHVYFVEDTAGDMQYCAKNQTKKDLQNLIYVETAFPTANSRNSEISAAIRGLQQPFELDALLPAEITGESTNFYRADNK